MLPKYQAVSLKNKSRWDLYRKAQELGHPATKGTTTEELLRMIAKGEVGKSRHNPRRTLGRTGVRGRPKNEELRKMNVKPLNPGPDGTRSKRTPSVKALREEAREGRPVVEAEGDVLLKLDRGMVRRLGEALGRALAQSFGEELIAQLKRQLAATVARAASIPAAKADLCRTSQASPLTLPPRM